MADLSCFEGLFSCPEASSVLFHNFCIYHIDPPGHEVGSPEIPPEQEALSVDDLADQVAEVLDYFGCVLTDTMHFGFLTLSFCA